MQSLSQWGYRGVYVVTGYGDGSANITPLGLRYFNYFDSLGRGQRIDSSLQRPPLRNSTHARLQLSRFTTVVRGPTGPQEIFKKHFTDIALE